MIKVNICINQWIGESPTRNKTGLRGGFEGNVCSERGFNGGRGLALCRADKSSSSTVEKRGAQTQTGRQYQVGPSHGMDFCDCQRNIAFAANSAASVTIHV